VRDDFQLFAVTASGPQRLPVPAQVSDLHGLLNGRPVGVYTAFRTYEHHLFLHLDVHLDRLQASMDRLGWHYRLDRAALRVAIDAVCRSYQRANARVRLDVLAALNGSLSRELIALAPFEPVPSRLYEQGVTAAIAPTLHRGDPLVKSADFVERRRSYLAQEHDVYELLLVDDEGRILEGSSSNFFAVRSGQLITADHGILHGVARRVVLAVADELDLPVVLTAPSVGELSTFDEAALSSSSRAIMPIVRINGQPVGNGCPGPVVQRLLAGYRRYVAAHVVPAVAD